MIRPNYLTCSGLANRQSVFSGRWLGFHHSNTRFKIQHAHVPVWLHLPVVHTQTLHSFSPCPSTTSNWDSNISKCVVVVAGKTWGTEKDKASHAIFGKAVRSESGAQRWLVHGMRKLHWNPFRSRGCNFWKSHEERWRFPSQSQPLSFIMWDSSMINFPSLYFWLSSKACSCRAEMQGNY